MIALRRLRQLAVGGRFDFEATIARQVPAARIIMADIRQGIDVAPAIESRRYMRVLAEAPIALDDRIGGVDAVDDDGNPGAAGNDQNWRGVGPSRSGRSDQNGQCQPSTHCCRSRLLRTTYPKG